MKEIILEIEKLIPGGEGLGRFEGKVVFVPGVLPGESVSVQIIEDKKDFARGEALAILKPSPQREKPLCPHYGLCGGCNFMHIKYASQLAFKVEIVSETLRRTAGIIWENISIEAGAPWEYRNRLQLHRLPNQSLGFMGRGSNTPLAVEHCAVAPRALDELLQTKNHDPKSIADRFPVWVDENGVTLNTEKENPEVTVKILGQAVHFNLHCFFQSNVAMLEKLIPYALQDLQGDTAVDLYCGVGLFGAFLNPHFKKILAIEENATALNYAKKNIVGKQHVFLAETVEKALRGQGQLAAYLKNKPDTIIVDPPRGGLGAPVRDFLNRVQTPHLIYVSCDPVTWARDLKDLLRGGYILEDLRLFDFYPQTSHIECVAKLSARK